jgi:hypothetical protein
MKNLMVELEDDDLEIENDDEMKVYEDDSIVIYEDIKLKTKRYRKKGPTPLRMAEFVLISGDWVKNKMETFTNEIKKNLQRLKVEIPAEFLSRMCEINKKVLDLTIDIVNNNKTEFLNNTDGKQKIIKKLDVLYEQFRKEISDTTILSFSSASCCLKRLYGYIAKYCENNNILWHEVYRNFPHN